MTTGSKTTAKHASARPEALTAAEDLKLRAQVTGQMVTDTALNMGLVAAKFSEPRFAVGGPVEVMGVADAITVEIEKVQAGDMTGVEAMLVAQAISLQNMAAQFLSRAADKGTGEALNIFGGLGLRAQAQSRATLATLIDLKFPRATVFAKNANVANGGPQQVNMGGAAPSHAPAHEVIPQSKLIMEGQTNGTLLDAGAASTAGNAYSVAQTLVALNGTEKPRGKVRRG
jgi:hypothetical protein